MLKVLDHTRVIAVVVMDGFSMLSLGSIVEPFAFISEEFNGIAPKVLLVGLNGKRVRSKSGTYVECDESGDAFLERLQNGRAPHSILVCSHTDARPEEKNRIVPLLRLASRMGVAIYGLGSITWLMAEIGILRGGKGTVHWKSLAAFAELNCDVEAENVLYVSNGMTASCAGELATLDLVLGIIHSISPAAAQATADQLLISFPRNGKTSQPGSQSHRLRNVPEELNQAVRIMVDNIENPLQASDIAEICGTSTRNLERLFQKHLKKPPMRYYTQMKLERAFELVTQTNLSIGEIAVASGFSSTGLLAKKFKTVYKETPGEIRRNIAC